MRDNGAARVAALLSCLMRQPSVGLVAVLHAVLSVERWGSSWLAGAAQEVAVWRVSGDGACACARRGWRRAALSGVQVSSARRAAIRLV
jgi:hypothetical protein